MPDAKPKEEWEADWESKNNSPGMIDSDVLVTLMSLFMVDKGCVLMNSSVCFRPDDTMNAMRGLFDSGSFDIRSLRGRRAST